MNVSMNVLRLANARLLAHYADLSLGGLRLNSIVKSPYLCKTNSMGSREFSKTPQLRSLFSIANIVRKKSCPISKTSSLAKRFYYMGMPEMVGTRNAPVTEGDLETTAFTWPEIKQGDCHQIEGRLVLRSDGTGHFRCITWTDKTHSGDNWHAVFSIMGSFGRFDSPPHIGPRMDDGHPSPRYTWESDFKFPSYIYNTITQVSQYYDC